MSWRHQTPKILQSKSTDSSQHNMPFDQLEELEQFRKTVAVNKLEKLLGYNDLVVTLFFRGQ